MFEFISEGEIEFTRIPFLKNSNAKHLVKFIKETFNEE